MGKFDSKSFNEKAFKYGVENPRIPNLKTNELKKSKALKGSADIRSVFTSQNGTVYAEIAMKGLLDGQAVNYDGETDITATSTKTFNRGVVVIGRAKAWTEKDFSDDVADEEFMDNVQDQVAEYIDNLDQNTILSILKGIFAMTGAKNLEFVNNHTYDISAETDAEKQVVGQTTLNSAMNKACGANKKKFSMVFMHSDVATNLENLRLVKHLVYTDKDGIERPLDLAAWNGKIVIIDDEMPVEEVTEGTGNDAVTYNKYTSYILGDGAIDYENIGAKVPYEMSRDPKNKRW